MPSKFEYRWDLFDVYEQDPGPIQIDADHAIGCDSYYRHGTRHIFEYGGRDNSPNTKLTKRKEYEPLMLAKLGRRWVKNEVAAAVSSLRNSGRSNSSNWNWRAS